MSARQKKAMLAHWLAQQKSAAREREKAKDLLELWFKRAKLALDAGELELARAAKDKATEAREEYRKATARLVEVEQQLEAVRAEKTLPNAEELEAARARALHTAGEFEKLGIDTRFAALEQAGFGAEGARPAGTGAAPASEHARALAEADALLDDGHDDGLERGHDHGLEGEFDGEPSRDGDDALDTADPDDEDPRS